MLVFVAMFFYILVYFEGNKRDSIGANSSDTMVTNIFPA